MVWRKPAARVSMRLFLADSSLPILHILMQNDGFTTRAASEIGSDDWIKDLNHWMIGLLRAVATQREFELMEGGIKSQTNFGAALIEDPFALANGPRYNIPAMGQWLDRKRHAVEALRAAGKKASPHQRATVREFDKITRAYLNLKAGKLLTTAQKKSVKRWYLGRRNARLNN